MANLRINDPSTFTMLDRVKGQLISSGKNPKADYEETIRELYRVWELNQ